MTDETELMRKDCSVHRASGSTDEIARRVVIETNDRGRLVQVRVEEESEETFGWDTIESYSPAGKEVSRF